MGFSFRKSIRLGGGMRLNLSTRGVGVSGGVKGLRISSNTSRGTQLYAGVGGLRYQQSLNGKKRRKGSSASSMPATLGAAYNLEVYPVAKPRVPWKRYALLKWFLLLVIPVGILSSLGIEPNSGAKLIAWQVYLWGSLAGSVLHSYLKARRGNEATEGYGVFQRAENAGSPESRIAELTAAFALYPDIGIRARLAAALFSADRHEEAIPLLRSSLELPLLRDLDGVIYKLGLSLLAVKKYEEAIGLFEQIDEKDEYEDFLEVLALKARCYFEMQQHDKAMEVIKSVLSKRGEDSVEAKRHARVLQARILDVTGETKEAISVLKKLLKDVPDFSEAKNLLEELEKKSA